MTRRLNSRNLLALAILVLAGALTVTVVRNFRGASPEQLIEALPRNVDLSLQQIRYTETRDGVRRWTLTADAAAHSAQEGVTRVENIRMTFYDETGPGEVTLTARRGTIRPETREVEARDEVVVQSSRGYTLHAEQLQYSEAERLIRTDGPVRMVSATAELSGKGMRFNVQDHTLVLLSEVRARIQQAGGGRG